MKPYEINIVPANNECCNIKDNNEMIYQYQTPATHTIHLMSQVGYQSETSRVGDEIGPIENIMGDRIIESTSKNFTFGGGKKKLRKKIIRKKI